MKITGIICNTCGCFIFSRWRHDYHSCDCGYPDDNPNGTGVTIDGGFDYLHCGWATNSNFRVDTRVIDPQKLLSGIIRNRPGFMGHVLPEVGGLRG